VQSGVIATFVALVLRAFQGDAAPALLLASVPWSIDASPRTPALSFSICSDCVTRTMTILRRGDVGERVLRFRRDESTVPPFPVRRQLYAAVIAVTRDVARVMQSRRDTYRSQAPPAAIITGTSLRSQRGSRARIWRFLLRERSVFQA
jgi:hypothetical protein